MNPVVRLQIAFGAVLAGGIACMQVVGECAEGMPQATSAEILNVCLPIIATNGQLLAFVSNRTLMGAVIGHWCLKIVEPVFDQLITCRLTVFKVG